MDAQPNQTTHEALVDDWLAQAAPAATSEQLLMLFERSMKAVSERTRRTLGDITLTAILDRVLFTAAAEHPFLTALRTVDAQVQFDQLRAGPPRGAAEMRSALRFTVVEFLTLLGNLTAEILTPALHQEISKIRLKDADRGIDR